MCYCNDDDDDDDDDKDNKSGIMMNKIPTLYISQLYIYIYKMSLPKVLAWNILGTVDS